MVLTGGWRVLAGALLLSAGLVAPAASADPVAACTSWNFVELPVPPAVQSSGVVAGAGSFAVGNGSFWSMDGTTVLVWKDGQQVDQLSFFRNVVRAHDVNSSGVVVLSAYTFPSASQWKAGVYESLPGLPGEYRVEAFDVNERGDVLGRSDGKPVVWPADSAVPYQVPGTDASWTAVGIADDGSVLASSSTGAHWIRPSGALVPLGEAEVRAVRGNYAVGVTDSKVVRWDLSGAASESFAFASRALAVNSHGHLLGAAAWGDTQVWETPQRSVPVPAGGTFASLTDEGDVYGTLGADPRTLVPLLLDCAGGAR
ncbi:hypothetical protein [Lentzea sp. E54]|uniref:hypothetical protein n=1 Tax=Lentzea xerophila TaxID=3435883 RepID=UPI003DA29DC7